MILRTPHGNRLLETRAAGEWGTEHLIPWPSDVEDAPVTIGSALALPAVSAAIRLVAETVASMALCVWEGEYADRRKRSDSWQAKLFAFPNDEVSAYTFMADLASCIESCGNADIYKARLPMSKQIGALSVLDPTRLTIRRDRESSEVIYEYWDGQRSRTLNAADVLHIRGWTAHTGFIAPSPIQAHAQALGKDSARQRFAARHYVNNAQPGVALKFPQTVDHSQAKEWAEQWDKRHQGNPGRTAVVGGGADITTFPISLEDAQFVESERFSVQDVARIFRVPAALLEEGEFQSSEEESLRFLKFSLLPRLNLIEHAFKSDPDLFGRDSTLYPEFHLDEFLRSDAATMADVSLKKVQSGQWLIDEARGMDGMGPLPPVPDDPDKEPGKVPQIVPVGGQANPGSPPPPKE